MFNTFFARTAATLEVLGATARTRVTKPARGVTFIEYALLAVVAVIIGYVFRTQLGSAFDGMLARVRGGLTQS